MATRGGVFYLFAVDVQQFELAEIRSAQRFYIPDRVDQHLGVNWVSGFVPVGDELLAEGSYHIGSQLISDLVVFSFDDVFWYEQF